MHRKKEQGGLIEGAGKENTVLTLPVSRVRFDRASLHGPTKPLVTGCILTEYSALGSRPVIFSSVLLSNTC